MCDTLIALGNSTEDGSVIFGKNSDRPSNEAQLITYSPHQKYRKDELVKCTYISIPQVSETNAILLSQPWWMWGAESGSNQYGVVIGNEAVHPGEINIKDNPETARQLFEIINEIIEDRIGVIEKQTKINEIYQGLPETKLKHIRDRDNK